MLRNAMIYNNNLRNSQIVVPLCNSDGQVAYYERNQAFGAINNL